jgi:small subunit ribosomal protein S16
MLKIKLQRIGKKGQPQYRIVVREDRMKQGGMSVAEIGYYNPLTKPAIFELDAKQYQEWLKKGAQPTDTIRQLATQKITK